MEYANRILILFAHPAFHKSRVNQRLVEEISNLDGITFHDLYASYPDFHIHVKEEQELLMQHKIIVWHHPFYWYSAPAILKEWIDLVLQHGWAYGSKGNMLKGKYVFSAITAGGGHQAYEENGYNGYTIQQFMVPFRQTAKLCKMIYLPPFAVLGTHLLQEADIREHAQKYRQLLISLRDNLFEEADILKNRFLNELID